MESKEKILVPNIRVTLRRHKKDGYEIYQSRIEDVSNEFVILAMPTKEGEIVPLQAGDQLEVSFTRNNGLYVFKGSVVRRERQSIPLLYLALPEKIERQQRRQYVRVETFLPVSFRTITPEERLTIYEKCASNPQFKNIKFTSPASFDKTKNGKEPLSYQGIIHNLSGGGMLVVSPQKFSKEEILLFRFALHSGGKKSEIFAYIVRAYEFNSEDTSYPFSMGLQYLMVDTETRHKIIQYTFTRQIQLKNKGVL